MNLLFSLFSMSSPIQGLLRENDNIHKGSISTSHLDFHVYLHTLIPGDSWLLYLVGSINSDCLS